MPTSICLKSCATNADCTRQGYVCQPEKNGPGCLPKCQLFSFGGQSIDTCQLLDTTLACDVDSGVCGGPISPVQDGGSPDAGAPDAGARDAGTPDAGGGSDGGLTDAGTDAGSNDETVTIPAADVFDGPASAAKSCGCGTASPAPLMLALLALVLRRRLKSA
jgi:hypothetical protein